MTDYTRAILFLDPAAQFGISGNDYKTLEWKSVEAAPTQAACDAAWPTIQANDAAAATAAQNAASNTATLTTQASNALTNLRAYRDATSPTNAQTVAIVQLLCRVCIGLIRFQIKQLADGSA